MPSLEHVIIGNEPNLNRFWLPQFGLDGSSAAPAAYLALLAGRTTRSRPCRPDVTVYGGAVSPRGSDRPDGVRPTHSPTNFIQGSASPIAPAAAPDPSWTPSSSTLRRQLEPAPSTAHPTTRRSVSPTTTSSLRFSARRSTDRAAGSTLPIFYGEFGVESEIPVEQGGPLHGHRAGDDATRQRGDAGRVLRAGARALVLPAHGRRRAPLPLARRARASGLAVGGPLRRRDAEDEQARWSRGRSTARRAARSRAVPASSSP